jgi:hypothetical protein
MRPDVRFDGDPTGVANGGLVDQDNAARLIKALAIGALVLFIAVAIVGVPFLIFTFLTGGFG